MNHTRLMILVSFIFIISLMGCRSNEPSIQLTNVWARPADLEGNSAVYFTIRSRVSSDKLISATCSIAGSVQIHRTRTNDDGTVTMEEKEFVDLPKGTWIYFLPGGFHIMLMDLETPLSEGDTFPLTLHFESTDDLTIEVPVMNQ